MQVASVLRQPSISSRGRVLSGLGGNNSLILRAETWPGQNSHGSVGLSLQPVFGTPGRSEQP